MGRPASCLVMRTMRHGDNRGTGRGEAGIDVREEVR